MSHMYSCPRCRTQNFAAPGRLRRAAAVPVKCWKCGKLIPTHPTEKSRKPRKRTR